MPWNQYPRERQQIEHDLQAPDLGHVWPRRPVGVAEARIPRRDSGLKAQTQVPASVNRQLTSGLLRDPGDTGVTEQIGFKDPRNGEPLNG